MHIRFTFDFISPYAWFAWYEIRDLAKRCDATVSFQPVLFAALLNHWGHKGPAEIPPKRLFTIKHAARRAARRGVPFGWPPAHPFNPLTVLRCALPQVAGDQQEAVIDALYRGIWGGGLDPSAPQSVASALSDAGLDGAALVARTREPEVKSALIQATQEAAARGLFGVPTMEVGDELFWGSDVLDDLEDFLMGRDPIDAAAMNRLVDGFPMAAQRPGSLKGHG